MSTADRVPAGMRIPPPLMFVVAFLAGVALQRFAAVVVPHLPIVRGIGIALVVAGAFLALYSLATFLVARTTVVPFSNASKLVTWGPYRFTRNPMYVSLVLAYLGIACVSSQPLALIFLPLPILVIRTVVIPFEEQRMRTVFGAEYERYCARVRRWL